MAVVINGSTGIDKVQDGTITSADLASGVGGKVLQVVSYTFQGTNNFTSTTFAATSLTANITPSSTSSKILVQISLQYGGSGGAEGAYFRLYRGGSHLTASSGIAVDTRTAVMIGGQHSEGYGMQSGSGQYLDSPSSTSQQTYTIYGANQNSIYNSYLNRGETDGDNPYYPRGASTITLMEIGA